MLGEHNLWAKKNNYRQANNVPLIIKHPEIKSQTNIENLFELVDLFPTVIGFINRFNDHFNNETPKIFQGMDQSGMLLNLSTTKKHFARYIFPACFSKKVKSHFWTKQRQNCNYRSIEDIKFMSTTIVTHDWRLTLWNRWIQNKVQNDFLAYELFNNTKSAISDSENYEKRSVSHLDAVINELKQYL
jgi:hypothetical protein